MGPVTVAIASSVLAGASAGVVLAAASNGDLRPRRALRHHCGVARCVGSCLVLAGSVTAVFGVFASDHQRLALALTCIAAALLLGFATWVLLVEPDDHYPSDTPDEPEWWPAFERELEAWTQRARVSSGTRS